MTSLDFETTPPLPQFSDFMYMASSTNGLREDIDSHPTTTDLHVLLLSPVA